jgi:mRNA-degrading endonuclease toxin of MazEF toxin-antitoxin module
MTVFTEISKRVNSEKNAHPRPWDLWWMNICQYDGSRQYKGRPVVVRCVKGDVAICYQCTSQYHEGITDYRIMDPVSAGLAKTTYVKNQTMAIPLSRLSRRIGKLSPHDVRCLTEVMA